MLMLGKVHAAGSHVLATSRSHSTGSNSSIASGATKVGATSASWSFPITSSFLPPTSPTYQAKGPSSTSSYLKNHATTYSAPDYGLKSQVSTRRPEPIYTYYNTPSTTSMPTTTPLSFAYNLPYNPLDYYFESKNGAKVSHVAPDAYKVDSAPSTNYYISDYDDDEPDRYLTRTDKKPDFESVETSPTYVKTKYGYSTKNPLINDDPKTSGLSRNGGRPTGADFKTKEKVTNTDDKNYAASASDHYDYKGYDYADFGYPEFDHGHHPYSHRHKHHSGKGPLALLLGLLPLGLLMAALVPSVVNIPIAAVGAAGRRRRGADEKFRHQNPILEIISKFGVNSLDDPDCLQQIFCEVTREGKAAKAMMVPKIFYTLSTL